MKNDNNKYSSTDKTKRLVLTAMLLAFSILLSYIEQMLPPLPIAVPGVKLGLSNIMVMYALFFVRFRDALFIVVLKSLFVFSTRSFISAILSLSGGLLSLIVMIILLYFFGDKISYTLLSISGAVFHNLGQIAAASLIYNTFFVVSYLPVLLISGVLTGIATATLLRFIFPAIKMLGFNKK